jgi:hypothetical protein
MGHKVSAQKPIPEPVLKSGAVLLSLKSAAGPLYASGNKSKKNKKLSRAMFMEYQKKLKKKPRQRARFPLSVNYKKL